MKWNFSLSFSLQTSWIVESSSYPIHHYPFPILSKNFSSYAMEEHIKYSQCYILLPRTLVAADRAYRNAPVLCYYDHVLSLNLPILFSYRHHDQASK